MGVCLSTPLQDGVLCKKPNTTGVPELTARPPPLASMPFGSATDEQRIDEGWTHAATPSAVATTPLSAIRKGRLSPSPADASKLRPASWLPVPRPTEAVVDVQGGNVPQGAVATAATTLGRPLWVQGAVSMASLPDDGPNSAVLSLSSHGGSGVRGRLTMAVFSPLRVSPLRPYGGHSRAGSVSTWDDFGNGSSRYRSSEGGPLSSGLFDPSLGHLATVGASPLRYTPPHGHPTRRSSTGSGGGGVHRRQDYVSPPSVFSLLVADHGNRSCNSASTSDTTATANSPRSMTGVMELPHQWSQQP